MLITVEGVTGAGKSTLIKELVELLKKKKKEVYVSSWNSYSPTNKIINREKDIRGLKKYSHFDVRMISWTRFGRI
ncbi:hypothetical protein FHQ08_12225 [Lactobacillus sp. CC-MHH1034]|uniref:hypothetical protein n=1 Tax=Agrilactobacillus fermenti TaxID=2586909 RepID=UPI001E488545|nr:hypothetical protein [Agrilactobacillus fermenti]MCD2257453.1 hypothetical protein [Agrilactobacillus fermenti]